MQATRYLIALLLCAALFSAGCTQNTSPPTQDFTTTTAVPGSLVSYALTSSDVPEGFELTENRMKDATEVSQLAMDLGWQAGYVVRYFNASDKITDTNSITQTIAVYPEKNIPDIISVAEKQVRADANMTNTILPVTGFGDNAIAIKGTPVSQMVVQPEGGLITGLSSLSQPDTATASLQKETLTIFFSKGDVFEVIQVKGPGIDMETFTTIATAAYKKLG